MAIDGEDHRQADGGFRRRDADGKNREHHAGQRLGVRSKAPEGDEIQVGGVQHQLNADQNKNGVAPGERAGEADGKDEGRDAAGSWSSELMQTSAFRASRGSRRRSARRSAAGP